MCEWLLPRKIYTNSNLPILVRLMDHLAIGSSPIVERCRMCFRETFQCHAQTFNSSNWISSNAPIKRRRNPCLMSKIKSHKGRFIAKNKVVSCEFSTQKSSFLICKQHRRFDIAPAAVSSDFELTKENLPNWWGIQSIGGTAIRQQSARRMHVRVIRKGVICEKMRKSNLWKISIN